MLQMMYSIKTKNPHLFEKTKNILVISYTAVLVLMNFIRCFDNALWGDEAFSAARAREPLLTMIESTAADVHPPLYYIFTRISYLLVGDSGFAYHFVSFLPYFILIIVALTIIRKEMGLTTALTVVTFSSVTESAVRYNVEIRMYSWACLFVLLSYLCVYFILKRNSWNAWVLMAVFSLSAAYTHYYALIMVAVFYAGLILLSIFQKQYRFKCAAISIATIIGYLPWLLILILSFKRTASEWWLKNIPTLKSCGYVIFNHKWVFLVFAASFVLFILYETDTLNIKYDPKKAKDKIAVKFNSPKIQGTNWMFPLFGIMSAAGTVVVGLSLSYMIRPFFLERYLFPISAVMYVVLGYLISRLKLKKIWCLLVIIVYFFQSVPGYVNIFQAESMINQNTSNFCKQLQLDDSDLVLSNNRHQVWTIIQYYYPQTQASLVSENIIEKVDNTKDNWIFWIGELPEKEIEALNEASLDCVFVMNESLGFADKLNVYQIIDKGEKVQ